MAWGGPGRGLSPITSWRYRKDESVVRHIGPMAQDLHAAFGLWNSDTMTFPLDGSGASMAPRQLILKVADRVTLAAMRFQLHPALAVLLGACNSADPAASAESTSVTMGTSGTTQDPGVPTGSGTTSDDTGGRSEGATRIPA